MRDFDWKLTHLVACRCINVDNGPDGKPQRAVDHLLSTKAFKAEQEPLELLLDALLLNSWNRRADIGDTSPCRAYAFKDDDRGQEDMGLLSEMVSAIGLKDFEERALLISERYAATARAREGVLLHVSVVVESGRARQAPFYFFFKVDFEDAHRLTPKDGLEKVSEVILDKLKKVLMFPLFDGVNSHGDRVKIYQSNPADYFHDVLNLEIPQTAKVLLQQEVREAVAERHPDRYEDWFVGQPPAKRELFGEERYIPVQDLMPTPEVKFVNNRSCQAAREKYDKTIKARITIDGITKVVTEVDGLGKSFFFARRGKQRFMIIKGEQFETTGPLSGLDFLDLEDIETVMPLVTEEGGPEVRDE